MPIKLMYLAVSSNYAWAKHEESHLAILDAIYRSDGKCDKVTLFRVSSDAQITGLCDVEGSIVKKVMTVTLNQRVSRDVYDVVGGLERLVDMNIDEEQNEKAEAEAKAC